MRLCVKRSHELTLDELYRLLRLRVAVFVVEQNCPYMELDDRDQEAVHVWLEDAEGMQAYLRVMDRGVESEHVSIGRVIAVKRCSGVGSRLLREGIRNGPRDLQRGFHLPGGAGIRQKLLRAAVLSADFG